jgi:hypothetical protein
LRRALVGEQTYVTFGLSEVHGAVQRGVRGRRVSSGSVPESLQDADLDDARVSSAALGGRKQPVEQTQRVLERAGVVIDALPGDQQPRQGEVLVLAQIGGLVPGR